MTVLVAVLGVIVHEHRVNVGPAGATFETDKTTHEPEEKLGSFPELGTDRDIVHYDETVSLRESEIYGGDISDLPSATGVSDGKAAAESVTTAAGESSTSGTAVSAETQSTAGGGTTLHDYKTGNDYAYAYAGFTPKMANLDISDWRLLLVNRNYMLPQDYSPALAEAAKGTGVRMDARVAPYYQQMYDAAQAEGITLTPLSGHRRISTQKTNFENKIQYYMNQGFDKATATQKAAEIILPPGTSEHNAGLAMDIISLDVSFENTKAFTWLQKNAAEYGFILRYPKNKEHVTKITYEPWHWRYVGADNAKKINASGKCLEEYLGVTG